MNLSEWRYEKRRLLTAIQERTYEIEEMNMLRRKLIEELEGLERQKPQRGTEAFNGNGARSIL